MSLLVGALVFLLCTADFLVFYHFILFVVAVVVTSGGLALFRANVLFQQGTFYNMFCAF